MYSNENEFKADNSALNIPDVIRSCNQLSREQLCKAYDILHNGFKSKSHYSLKVQEMKSIFGVATQPCCSFERWLLLIEYLKLFTFRFIIKSTKSKSISLLSERTNQW